MSNLEHSTNGFSAGMKVEINIPLPYAKVFRDWAVIRKIDEGLLTLQLSRDLLPVGVWLRMGQILELRSNKDKSDCFCHAVVVSRGVAQELHLRLISGVTPDEPREFYRIDVVLPIKYYISRNQHPLSLERQWEDRRNKRQTREREVKKQQLEKLRQKNLSEARSDKQSIIRGNPSPRSWKIGFDQVDSDLFYTAWDAVAPLAANISGGGLSLLTKHGFAADEFVLVEVLVPSPRRIVDAVARVVFSKPNGIAGEEQGCFNTGLQFVFLDENDRFAIVNYSNSVQLARIRQSHGFNDLVTFDYANSARPERHDTVKEKSGNINHMDKPATYGLKHIIREAALLLLILSVVGMLSVFLSVAVAKLPQNEIAVTFENGIKEYLESMNR